MYDVAIVGAGPAGASAARQLARNGARVLLLDGSHPREKPCGGGITGRALALVGDAVPPGALNAVTVGSARFLDSGGRTVRVPLPSSASLVVSDRRIFDRQLLDAACEAGATFVPSRVSSINRHNRGFGLRTASAAYEARILVGADGVTSFVRRTIAVPLGRADLSIATGYYAHGVTSDEIVLELIDDPPGYLWSFPRPDHLAIGICTQAGAGAGASLLRERATRWIRDNGLVEGARLEPYSWPIPSLRAASMARAILNGEDWVLVGDAAGLVDPLTREGIYFALRSAQLAAQAIAAGDLAGYGGSVRREILPELSRAARLKDGFFRPRFRQLIMEALATSTPIRAVMADLIAGTQPYQGLQWRLARTLEVGLAMKLFSARARGSRRAPALVRLAD